MTRNEHAPREWIPHKAGCFMDDDAQAYYDAQGSKIRAMTPKMNELRKHKLETILKV